MKRPKKRGATGWRPVTPPGQTVGTIVRSHIIHRECPQAQAPLFALGRDRAGCYSLPILPPSVLLHNAEVLLDDLTDPAAIGWAAHLLDLAALALEVQR